ncbi:response regulator [Coxiella endosymbiont of Amblyomma nuttalli]|uniref:response regulator n=1 Tax=Coxiella endosymbiont of Amblyomma nuttalli TaxID=2749996 RepID=UPI001BA45C64|nr:response regulator [Coxiella endosymbiont of Amblyomma nuttalli]QTS84024.1 Phosphate regulon transcriptional regulatory protein PhoB [Coxiella endosymbiont of Amblyomma nuttalli]
MFKRKITILVIEDETAIRDMIRFSLPDEFELTDAEDVSKAIQRLSDRFPQLILLDWMLPGKNGIEFIKWIRKKEELQDIPIIMLTAKAEEENKIKGLITGADDYITKPFSPDELIARIRAVLRRGLLISLSHEIKYGNIVINTAKNIVTIQNKTVALSPTEYKTLHFFMKRPDKTYTRDQLITYIWGANKYIDDRTVDVQIRRLRNKLKKYDHHHLIKTIRGTGYQFSTHDTYDTKE